MTYPRLPVEGYRRVERTLDDAERRIAELELLVSTLRHGLNGALTPALLAADRLAKHADPQVCRASESISAAILRATKLLKSSRDVVAPRSP
jgi:hypothetical protein